MAKLNASDQIVARYFYGTKSNVPDFMWKNNGYYRIISDHLGSVRLVIKTDGTIAQRLSYDAFGNVLQNTSPGFQSFAFAGGLYDEDTKLVRFGARDYDSMIGRWTVKEPIGFAGSNNFYSYTNNGPINNIDPSGFQTEYTSYGNFTTTAIDATSTTLGNVIPQYVDPITPCPPPGVKNGSWNNLQSREPLPDHYTESSDWDISAMICGLGKLVTNEYGMPILIPEFGGINLPAVASRTAQRTKFFYYRNALQVNEFGAGYLDGFPGYPQVIPSYYYCVGVTSGYVTYEVPK